MDGQRFDELTRLFGLTLPRRRFLALVAGIAAPAMLAVGVPGIDAKKSRHKHRNRKRRRTDGVGTQGNGVCAGTCTDDGDCPDLTGCICDVLSGQCTSVVCGGVCSDVIPCQDATDCFCNLPSAREGVGAEGDLLGQCVTDVCGGPCENISDCQGPTGCICDEGTNQCVTVTCGGFCNKDVDCPPSAGCQCVFPNGAAAEVGAEVILSGFCTTVCAGDCTKDAECADLPDCVCNIPAGATVGTCGAPEECPGTCEDNPDCTEQGQDDCVCFLGVGVDVANPADFEADGFDGGSCGACLGVGAECNASTECCGQLVCGGGTCRRKRKPKPKDRCNKHGQGCRGDNDCCAQAVCYKGKCGEKDTHCRNDNECAQGYRCQGGPLAPGHRRCRKSGRHKRNKTNRKNG